MAAALAALFSYTSAQAHEDLVGPTKPVEIVNPPGRPVPTIATGKTEVTGTVSIGNAPTVRSEQSGFWSVGIAGTPLFQLAPGATVSIQGTPSVRITNTPTVALTPGTTVELSGSPAVRVEGPTEVGIDPGRNGVQIANTNANPVPVRTVDAQASEPFQVALTPDPASPFGGFLPVTVPSGSRLVIEFVTLVGETGSRPHYRLAEVHTTIGSQTVVHYFDGVVRDEGGFVFFTVDKATRLYADPGTTVLVQIPQGGGEPASISGSLSGTLIAAP
jgi:hypothetical protein